MNHMNKLFGTIVVGAVATLAMDASAKDAAKSAGGEHFCQNNSCKGKSACHGHGNAECAGKNGCAGQGWLKAKDAKSCGKAGGKWAKADAPAAAATESTEKK